VILVAGGTGTLGARLVPLLAAGERVRVLTRDPARAGGLPDAVEVAVGDIRRPRDLVAAVAGCRTVVSAVHGFAGAGQPSPEAIDRDGNRALLRVAADGGVRHVVLVSVHGAAPDHPMSLHRAKFVAEEELRRSGLAFTIIRATPFLETWMAIIGSELAGRGHALVFGPGRNPINFVSVRDVAALVAVAARDEALRGETLELGGPEDLTFRTFAERLIEAGGKPGVIKHVPLAALRALSVLARPFSPVFARLAKAAVVMNTTDMTLRGSSRPRFPALPDTRLADLLEQPGAHGRIDVVARAARGARAG
jgi:uncharacterized protein YbjT (DUF2867 family)